MSEQATPHDGSLEGAASSITSLLSAPADKKPARETKPEPVQASEEETPESQQASAAAEGEETPEGSEQAETHEAEEPAATSQPRTFKVKVDGQEIEVTEDEVLKGYSRTEDYSRKTMRLAEERAAFEKNEVAAVRAERAQYGQYLTELKEAITKAAPAEPDWEALRNTVSPDVFTAEWVRWQAHTKNVEKIEAEQAKVAAQQKTDAEDGFKRYVTDQQTKLEAALPVFKDPEKAPVVRRELSEFAKSRGFTDDDLSMVTDHRLVLLLHDAMQHAKAKAKAPVIENKITKALETSGPGANVTTRPKANAKAAAFERVKQSGSLEDGAAAIAHLL